MKRILFAAALMLLVPSGAWAQDAYGTADTLRLTLRQAQDYALEHNRTLKNASLSVRQAEADRWSSIASMLPQVNGTLDYSNYLGYSMNLGGMASIAMPPYGSLGVNASLALSGAQVISARIGTISMKMADISRQQTEQEIAEQVKLLYFSALVSEHTLKLLKENLVTIRKLYEFSQKSVDVGVSEQVDADQILVQVSTMETSINASQRALEMVYNSLRLQMNVDFDTDIRLTETLEELLDVESSLGLLYEAFNIENNYSYRLALANIDLARQQKYLAGWAYGPTLSAYYQYTAREYFSDEATMNMTPPNMIGVTLSVPIFSSGQRFGALRSARLAYQQQLNTLEDTEMSLRIQHGQLRYNLSSAYESYQTQKKNVEVSQSVFDNISKKYEFGLASSLDVTTSASNLISAQSGYVQAAYEYVNARIELEKLLNKNYYE